MLARAAIPLDVMIQSRGYVGDLMQQSALPASANFHHNGRQNSFFSDQLIKFLIVIIADMNHNAQDIKFIQSRRDAIYLSRPICSSSREIGLLILLQARGKYNPNASWESLDYMTDRYMTHCPTPGEIVGARRTFNYKV